MPKPVISAVKHGRVVEIEDTIAAGNDVNEVDGNGKSALMHAVMRGNLATIHCLIRLGADVNLADNWGRTALHQAARTANYEAAVVLIEHGADIYLQNEQGQAAIDDAVSSKHFDHDEKERLKELFEMVRLWRELPFAAEDDHEEKEKKKAETPLTGRLWADNHSYSLGLPHELLADNGLVQQIINVMPYVIEHAERRVELFFYLLVTYYKQGLTVKLGETKGQHGRGSKQYGTNACHSSLLSSVTDTETTQKHGYNTRSKGKIHGNICQYGKTHFFEDSLDATMELPAAVNDFDRACEGQTHKPSSYRITALETLNEVSRGERTPIEGLGVFLKRSNEFFHSDKIENYVHHSSERSPSDVRELIRKYLLIGLLANKYDENSDTLNLDYVCMLLRMSQTDTNIVKSTSDEDEVDTILNKYFLERGEEIRTCSV